MWCTRCRFPNSGIIAKIFVRKIGFKLYVMRLNRVESFYAFLLCFRSEGSPCKGQPGIATASPLAGVASCGKAPFKGYSQGQPARGRPARSQTVGAAARGWPAAALRPGSACRGGAHGGADRRGGRPLAEWLPAGKGSRRLRRGSSGGGAVRVKEG
ncbi:hypothetical protein GW17_00042333 [Ensete ventricosum]|nr:hypothetical protein GW17_00042333 [Ensete ventricosum]